MTSGEESCDSMTSASDSEDEMSLEVVKQVIDSQVAELREVILKEFKGVTDEIKQQIASVKIEMEKDRKSSSDCLIDYDRRIETLETELEDAQFGKKVQKALTGKIVLFTGQVDLLTEANVRVPPPAPPPSPDNHSSPAVTPPAPRQEPPNTPRSSVSGSGKKFTWTGYKEAESFIRRYCESHNFTRAADNKHDCYKMGIQKNMWPKDTRWQIRVYYKIDSVCNAAVRKRKQ